MLQDHADVRFVLLRLAQGGARGRDRGPCVALHDHARPFGRAARPRRPAGGRRDGVQGRHVPTACFGNLGGDRGSEGRSRPALPRPAPRHVWRCGRLRLHRRPEPLASLPSRFPPVRSMPVGRCRASVTGMARKPMCGAPPSSSRSRSPAALDVVRDRCRDSVPGVASASWNEIGSQTGRPASSCASAFKRHHARLIDGHEPFRQAAARVSALVVQAIAGQESTARRCA